MLDSFRSRLVLSNLLITLVGLLLVVFVFSQVLADRSRTIKETDLASQSRLVASQVESLILRGAPPRELATLVTSASQALHVRIVIVGPNGRIVEDSASTTPYFKGSWHPLDQAALKAARTARQTLQSGSLERFQSPLQGTRGHEVGAVLLVASVSDVRPTLASLANVIFVVLGTALLVWLAIGLYFTFSISRPLLSITSATEQMARGDYEARVPVRGHGEISRLATRFNEMAEKVQTTNRLLKDFVANVSHDLRTPLTMITGFSEALRDGTAGGRDAAESVDVIHDEALKMQRMVDDLLQLTRLESGLLSFRPEPVDVRSFVQDAINRIGRVSDGDRAAIKNLVSPDLTPINVDREHLERALRNLLDNAMRYTAPSGEITVRAEQIRPGWVEIMVSDTGSGIRRQDLPRIFERFYRSGKSRERGQGHSGLGLAIVQEIVEAHGGKISVTSQEGRGTTFRFTVPAFAMAEGEAETEQPAETIQRPAAR